MIDRGRELHQSIQFYYMLYRAWHGDNDGDPNQYTLKYLEWLDHQGVTEDSETSGHKTYEKKLWMSIFVSLVTPICNIEASTETQFKKHMKFNLWKLFSPKRILFHDAKLSALLGRRGESEVAVDIDIDGFIVFGNSNADFDTIRTAYNQIFKNLTNQIVDYIYEFTFRVADPMGYVSHHDRQHEAIWFEEMSGNRAQYLYELTRKLVKWVRTYIFGCLRASKTFGASTAEYILFGFANGFDFVGSDAGFPMDETLDGVLKRVLDNLYMTYNSLIYCIDENYERDEDMSSEETIPPAFDARRLAEKIRQRF